MQAEATVRAGAGCSVRRWWCVAPLVLAGVVLAGGWLAAARAGGLGALLRLSAQAQAVISSTVAAGDAVGGPTDNAHVGAASVFSAASTYLYWDNPQFGAIGRGTIDGDPANLNQNFVTGTSAGDGVPIYIAVTVDRQHLYWAAEGWIGRANLDGSGVNQHLIDYRLNGDTIPPGQLAVDDHYIYFGLGRNTIAGVGLIGRANLDGSGVDKQFITVQGGLLLSGLAVDSNYIYWIDSMPGHQSIGRANLDGTGVDPSFIAGASAQECCVPGSLAVDGQHIYWTDPYRGAIGRANLDGTGVNWNFITGASLPSGVAVDFGHLYWTNYYNCNYNTDPPSSCAGGTIGWANLDGSGVNQSFITAEQVEGPGCHQTTRQSEARCGPSSAAVSAPTQPACLRTSPPPAPPIGGAVFARALDPGGSGANVVVIPAGVSWTGPDSCAGIAAGSDEVMTHPTSISVAPDVAVLLRDQPAGLVSAWGARDVGAGDPVPVLFPGRSDWETTEADILAPQQLLDSYNGCPACLLPNNLQLTPGPPNSDVAYQGDVSGATLIGATLTGSLTGWNFSGTQLPGSTIGSTINGVDVSGANFSGADLRGAHLVALQGTPPPTFVNVRVGAFNGSCTVFQNTNLVGTGFKPVQADLLVPGCEGTPLLPGSTAPLDLIALLAHTYQATVDFANAQFLVTAANRHVLAGVDLHAIDLAGVSLVGFPADFESTNFNGASLQKTSFELADLTRATFQDAQAAGASFKDATLNGAQFNSAKTNLENADFIQADVSSASFQERRHLPSGVRRGVGGRYQLQLGDRQKRQLLRRAHLR